MIVYNIRANGPFEYDKFILNIGQLHNETNQLKHMVQDSMLKQNEDQLSDHIKEYVRPVEKYGNAVYSGWPWNTERNSDSWLNILSSMKEATRL